MYYSSWLLKRFVVFAGEAKKYGITSDSHIVQGCTVGGAVLLGYLIGRRSML